MNNIFSDLDTAVHYLYKPAMYIVSTVCTCICTFMEIDFDTYNNLKFPFLCPFPSIVAVPWPWCVFVLLFSCCCDQCEKVNRERSSPPQNTNTCLISKTISKAR